MIVPLARIPQVGVWDEKVSKVEIDNDITRPNNLKRSNDFKLNVSLLA